MLTSVHRPGAVLGATALLAVLLVPVGAYAADGPPPASAELRVLSRVHTDTVSTFPTDSGFELASKADVAEGNGTRLDPRAVLFHLDDAALQEVRAGYEFIAPVGSEIWLAPESNPVGADGYSVLWPGFSTESVPAGALAGDRTTFTLENLDGPGDLELFTGGSLGAPNRLWSSDEGISSFTIGRTHMHASWAFTAPGTYAIDVLAEATTSAGTGISARNTYTFVVGDMAPAAVTTTSLRASPTSAASGEVVTLDATVSPAGATGWVEFLDGTTSLGHELVDAGAARLTTTLPLGERSLTARFVPALLNDFLPSTSTAVTVAVSEDADGEVFGISGWRASFAAGETIDLSARGVTLREGEEIRWLVRDSSGDDYITQPMASWTRDATTALDGVEIAVLVYDPTAPAGQRDVQQSPWQRFVITGENVGAGGLAMTWSGLAAAYYEGDPIRVTAEHAALAEDQSYRWVYRPLPYGTDWEDMSEFLDPPAGTNPFLLDTSLLAWSEIALEVVDAQGAVAGRSPAVRPAISARDLTLSGARSVYRAGDTLEIASTLTPSRGDVTYTWLLGANAWEAETVGHGPSLTLPVTADMDRTTLYLSATDTTTGAQIAQPSHVVRVTDSAPGQQVLVLAGLGAHGDHYHQGSAVVLQVMADPVASDSDRYRWEWKRPDQAAWSVMPDVTGPRHEVIAEQALDGTEVRATLLTSGGTELATSETGTILVDDHGAAPRQAVTVTGAAAGYRSGDDVSLRASVAPASVLARWEWHLQLPGAEDTQLLPNETASSITFPATPEMNGAQVTARLTFDDGRTYVQSAPTTLTVTAAPVPAISFVDVPADLQFAREIGWLASSSISTGWARPDGQREYRPLAPIARDAMAAFLYRLAGSPRYEAPRVSPFVDVATDNDFYTEIAWLHERKISTGWPRPDGTSEFRPLAPIARDAMAAFLFRYAAVKDYEAPATSAFSDVSVGNQFFTEISWLVESRITTGWSHPGAQATYGPLLDVKRDAMAAFLYRLQHPEDRPS